MATKILTENDAAHNEQEQLIKIPNQSVHACV